MRGSQHNSSVCDKAASVYVFSVIFYALFRHARSFPVCGAHTHTSRPKTYRISCSSVWPERVRTHECDCVNVRVCVRLARARACDGEDTEFITHYRFYLGGRRTAPAHILVNAQVQGTHTPLQTACVLACVCICVCVCV